MKLNRIALITAFAAAIGAAHAQSGGMKDMDMKMHKKAAGKVHKASGNVTKVDQAKGTVTIAHGAVASMSWPSMTMSFKAKDKAMLQKVKPGDQVEFSFVQSGKEHTLTEIK